MAPTKTHQGGCHCGKVRFEMTGDPTQCIACNCSICAKQGLWLSFTTPDNFKLVKGGDALVKYQFNKHVIDHLFCPTCGVEPFARGKDKDGQPTYAVNVRCLDGIDIATLQPRPFDGRSL